METMLPGLDAATNIHPLFVHFPLALWPTAFLFLLLGAIRGSKQALHTGRLLLYLASLAAIVTATSGWLAANSMGHDSSGHDVVHVHRNWMIAATALSLASAAVAFATRRTPRPLATWGIIALLAVTLAVATLGADRGALLVFKYGMGTSISATQAQGSGSSHERTPSHGHGGDDH